MLVNFGDYIGISVRKVLNLDPYTTKDTDFTPTEEGESVVQKNN